jgi:hypothetical protein
MGVLFCFKKQQAGSAYHTPVCCPQQPFYKLIRVAERVVLLLVLAGLTMPSRIAGTPL